MSQMSDHQQVVEVPGGAIAVRITGTGEPLVMVHGAGGDSHNWDGVAERLHDRWRCVLIDRAGYGGSRWESPEPTTRAVHGAHLRAVVAALGLRGAAAVGTSGGALTVVEALRHDPTLLARVALIEPPLRIEGHSVPTRSAPPPPDPTLDMEARGAASIRRLDPLAWERMTPADRQRYVRSFPAMFQETSQGSYEVPEAEIRSFPVPTAVIYGAATPEYLRAMSVDLAGALPRGTLREVPGAGHLMYLTHTDQVAALIEELLSVPSPWARAPAPGVSDVEVAP